MLGHFAFMTKPSIEKLFYRPAEAALAIGCSRRTIYNYADKGLLTIERIEGMAVISRDQLVGLPSRCVSQASIS